MRVGAPLRRALVLAAAVNLAFVAVLIWRPIQHDATLTGALTILGPFAMVVGICLWDQRWPVRRRDVAPVCLALAALSRILGQFIHIYYGAVLQQPLPVPSVADGFQLACYPLVLASILGLPVRPIPTVARTRIVFDSLMLLAATLSVSWYFVTGPTVLGAHHSIPESVVANSYPVGDSILFLSVLFLSGHARGPGLRAIIWLIELSLLLVVIADSVYTAELLAGSNAPDAFIDVLWSLGWLFGASGIRATRFVAPTGNYAEAALPSRGDWPLWRILLPYGLVPICSALVLYSWARHGATALSLGVLIGLAILVGLVLLRQVLAMLENRQLYRKLDQAYLLALEANARLAALSTTDPLTGLPNHPALNNALEHEIERSRRFARPFSVLFVDLDHFKALNDTFGHHVGDGALREFGEVLSGGVRGVDVVGRWGGEEFFVILPETDVDGARAMAERLRDDVANHRFSAGIHHLTCSFGVAAFPSDGETRDEIVGSADQAMYAAKRLGRNQVRIAAEPAVRELGVRELRSREETALLGVVEALAAMANARDGHTGQHMHEVGTLALRLALELGLDLTSARSIALAARLHDVGKVAIPDAILQKPASLDEAEWSRVRVHADVGADVISHVPSLRSLAPMIRAHHERWDGKGYPHGLVAGAIPLGARIIAVADAFTAMTQDRPYRVRLEPGSALGEIRRQAGRQFDPGVVEALDRVVEGEARQSSAGDGDDLDRTSPLASGVSASTLPASLA